MYACMHACMHACMNARTHACMFACLHASARVCNGVSVCLCIKTFPGKHEVWYGLRGTIGLTIWERKDHIVAEIMENYIMESNKF